MEINISQKEEIVRTLHDLWDSKCPLCNKNDWNFPNSLFELREFQGGNLMVGKSYLIPLIPITCNVCGNTVLLNAIKLGVSPIRSGENGN